LRSWVWLSSLLLFGSSEALAQGVGCSEPTKVGSATALSITAESSTAEADDCSGEGCPYKSRTFVATSTQYFTSANGSHSTLEAGVGQDSAILIRFKPTGTAGGYWLYYQGSDATARPGFGVFVVATGNTLRIRAADAAGAVTSDRLGSLTTAWHTLLAGCDRDSTLQGYYDNGAGMDATPADCPDGTFANAVALTVGALYTGASPANAYISEIGVWINTDFTTLVTAKTALYNAGEPLSCAVLRDTYGATACWGMNEAAGANEDDEIGAIDLTQVNAPGSADGPGCN
jgi:hypothetical protein